MPLSETILLLTALLALGIIASGLVRKAPIPYTVVLLIIGVCVGEISRRWEPLAPIQELSLTPELVLFVFLPVLIFESGLKLDARQLVKDIVPNHNPQTPNKSQVSITKQVLFTAVRPIYPNPA